MIWWFIRYFWLVLYHFIAKNNHRICNTFFPKLKFEASLNIKYLLYLLIYIAWSFTYPVIQNKIPYITLRKLQRACILLLKVIYTGSKEPVYYFKSNIRAQKWTQIGSNIRYFILYHWVIQQNESYSHNLHINWD